MSAPVIALVAPASLMTTLARVRCPQPAALERMQRSLQQHGQILPVIAVRRAGSLDLLDGFYADLSIMQRSTSCGSRSPTRCFDR